MPWPSTTAYNDAIQNLRTSVSDEELRAGELARTPQGLPLLWSGNFADVYRVHCEETGSTWAVKCFTRESPGLRDRYRQISDHLQTACLRFMVDFEFVEPGILAGGQWHPFLKMRWVEGLALDEFVEKYLNRPATLRQLLGLWVKLAARLREAQIAHADLQHGNVILVPAEGGELALRLIDYDGMYVPALSGTRSGELGHPAYQHPQRLREGTYNAEVDRFSHLAIYTAIRCMTVGGRDLWRFNNGDNLLFREVDFQSPGTSEVFQELWRLQDRDCRALVGRLALACQQPLEAVPLLEEVIADGKVRPLSGQEEAAAGVLLVAAKSAVARPALRRPIPVDSAAHRPWWAFDPAPATLPADSAGTAPALAGEPLREETALRPRRSEALDDARSVFLATAVPKSVTAGSEFVVRFAAYTNRWRNHIVSLFRKESPSSQRLLDVAACNWRVGVKVTVRLSSRSLCVTPDIQSFSWNGRWQVLRFDVELSRDCPSGWLILKLDIAVEGTPLIGLRPEIEVVPAISGRQESSSRKSEIPAPRTAFASYAHRDQLDVLGRIRSLQIYAGVDVFLDCLSIRPGDEWKPSILKEIERRDVFLLFWSRHAAESQWVDWEWHRALDKKTLAGIQPHPLEPVEVCPPPEELADLQFGSAFEFYSLAVRSGWLLRMIHRARVTTPRPLAWVILVVLALAWPLMYLSHRGGSGRPDMPVQTTSDDAKSPQIGRPQEVLYGKVVSVSKGDTLTILLNHKQREICLHGIDSPESDQPFGAQAKQFTSDFALGQTVTVEVVDGDGNGSISGDVFLPDGRRLNAEIVWAGMAWWDRQRAPEEKHLGELEAEARNGRRGLWADENVVPPWEWRGRRQRGYR